MVTTMTLLIQLLVQVQYQFYNKSAITLVQLVHPHQPVQERVQLQELWLRVLVNVTRVTMMMEVIRLAVLV